MKLDLKKLVFGDLSRMKDVKRYSSCTVLEKESVAEHSYMVALFALFVGTYFNSRVDQAKITRDEFICIDKVLQKAILHDLEESISGDIVRTFKNSDPILREMIESKQADYIQKSVADIFGKSLEHDDCWNFNKHKSFETIEGFIVAFCDALSVLEYAYREIQLGSRTIKKQIIDMKNYILEFDVVNVPKLQWIYDEFLQAGLLDDWIDILNVALELCFMVQNKEQSI